jgi:anti-sigma B factor antagonist
MALADLSVEAVEQAVVARVDGEIDMSNASELGTTISRQVPNEAAALVVDLSDVGYLDSAAIQVIYELHERLRSRASAPSPAQKPWAT